MRSENSRGANHMRGSYRLKDQNCKNLYLDIDRIYWQKFSLKKAIFPTAFFINKIFQIVNVRWFFSKADINTNFAVPNLCQFSTDYEIFTKWSFLLLESLANPNFRKFAFFKLPHKYKSVTEHRETLFNNCINRSKMRAHLIPSLKEV